MQVRHPFGSTAARAGTVALLVLAAPFPFAGGASAAQECDATYDVYSAVSAAAGMQVVSSAGAALPVNEADGGAPTAQSRVGSLSGSQAYAGAPYSEAAAGNLGVAGSQIGVPLSPNQVPVFSQSKYPTDLHDEKENAAFALSTTAARQSAEAHAAGGAPATPAGTSGRAEALSTTSCSADAVIKAVATNDVNAVSAGGVLYLGHVRSHAEAEVGPTGLPTLKGSMDVDGVSVLGQAVGVSDRGLVVAGTAVPLPDSSPLSAALETAGISLRYVAAEKNVKTGTVVAPGLEIVITRDLGSTAGAGVTVTTITLGQAVASVSRTGDAPAPEPTDDGFPTTPPSDPEPPAAVDPGGPVVTGDPGPIAPGPELGVEPPPVTSDPQPQLPQQAGRLLTRQALQPWSITRLYAAMAIGMCVLLVPTLGIKRVAVIRR